MKDKAQFGRAARRVGLGAALLSVLAIGSANASKPTLTVGIVPQQSATQLARVWVPFLSHIGDQAGVALEFATAKDIPTFEACLAQGAYDLAYMNPYHYTTFHDVTGYQAIARQAEKRLRGIIVARTDASIDALAQLDGAEVAFPSPAAFGASVIPRAEMRNSEINFTPVYVKSHDSVYRSVAAGLYPAGGGVLRTFGNIPDDLREQLQVIYQTEEYTPHAFAAHPRVDGRHVSAIAGALAGVHETAPAALQPLGMSGIQLSSDSDWDDIRSLGLARADTDIAADVDACPSG